MISKLYPIICELLKETSFASDAAEAEKYNSDTRTDFNRVIEQGGFANTPLTSALTPASA